jgi:hypothetical protein
VGGILCAIALEDIGFPRGEVEWLAAFSEVPIFIAVEPKEGCFNLL